MNTAQVAQNFIIKTPTSTSTSSTSPPLSSTTLNTSSDHNGKKADGSDNFSSSQEASNSQDANKSSSSSTVTLPSSKETTSSSPVKSLSKEKLCEKSSQKSIQGTSSAFSSMGNLSEKELSSSIGPECPHLVNPNYHYSRSHQRRFHRRFPAVDPQEKVIECKLLIFQLSCINDIL